MFKEIAVEPEVMAHWEWFLKLYDKFGYHEGMLLADFPSSWRREVIERAKELIGEGGGKGANIFLHEMNY